MAQDYKTMRVPEDAYDEAKAAKRDGETWGEYLRRCGETPPEVRRFVEVGDESDTASIIEDLERLQELVDQVPERTADELEGRRR